MNNYLQVNVFDLGWSVLEKGNCAALLDVQICIVLY